MPSFSASSGIQSAAIVEARVAPEGHTVYEIEVSGLDQQHHGPGGRHRVSHRYSSFAALDHALRRIVGRSHLPKLPPKRFMRQHCVCTAEGFKAERQHDLQTYLEELLQADLGGATHCLTWFLAEEREDKITDMLVHARALNKLDQSALLPLEHNRGPLLFSAGIPVFLLFEEDDSAMSDFQRSATAGALSYQHADADEGSLWRITSPETLASAVRTASGTGREGETASTTKLCVRFCSANFWAAVAQLLFGWDLSRTQVVDRRHGFLIASDGEVTPAAVLLVRSHGYCFLVTCCMMQAAQALTKAHESATGEQSTAEMRVDVRETRRSAKVLDDDVAWERIHAVLTEL